MPILAAETALFPEGLLDGMTAADPTRCWWAVYTKSRQEKALARQLKSLAVPFYLPLVEHENVIRGRRMPSLVPLFANYLFVFGNGDERVQTLATSRATHVLPAGDTPGVTRDLIHIRTLIESGATLNVEARLEPGRKVRVTSGALLGMEGTIIARRGRSRLLVAVDFLKQGVSVEIEDFQVEPV